MSRITYKQDMPPPGGYADIAYKRIPAKTLFGSLGTVLFAGAMMGVGTYSYFKTRRLRRLEEREMTDSKIALSAVFLAERDRQLLAHMRRLRDYEADLMKDVPGWEVGTYFGKPVFKTMPRDKWVEPWIMEFYGLCHESAYNYWLTYPYWY